MSERGATAWSEPNYRRYLAGRLPSLVGWWMHLAAHLWLVGQLTRNPGAIAAASALHFAPHAVLAPWTGTLADRVDPRRLLLTTQSIAALQAAVVGIAVATGNATLPLVYALAAVWGIVSAVDHPAREAFVPDIVGRDLIQSSAGFNNAALMIAGIAGPALAGITIGTIGLAACFFIDALTYAADNAALLSIRRDRLHPRTRARRSPTPIRDGWRAIRADPVLRGTLLLLAVVGTLGFNMRLLLLMMSTGPLRSGPGGYTAMLTAMGVGAVAGAVWLTRRRDPSPRIVTAAALASGAGLVVVAAAPGFPAALAALIALGVPASIYIGATVAVLQSRAEPSMRGRVMALFSLLFLGSTPVGNLAAGGLAAVGGPRFALAVAGLASIAAAAAGTRMHRVTRLAAAA